MSCRYGFIYGRQGSQIKVLLMFICDKCGECCRHLKGISIYADLDRGDGVCKYLEGNLCSIYENRPLFCRVDDCYELFFKDEFTREEFDRLNTKICNNLKRKSLCF